MSVHHFCYIKGRRVDLRHETRAGIGLVEEVEPIDQGVSCIGVGEGVGERHDVETSDYLLDNE